MTEPERSQAPESEALSEPLAITDADVDEVIAACGSDPREAVRALLIAGQFMEAALEVARQEASWGYVMSRYFRI